MSKPVIAAIVSWHQAIAGENYGHGCLYRLHQSTEHLQTIFYR
ncbi:MAG: hypothetical protein ACI9SK_001482, partial [Zhongshania sp.]